MFTAVDAVVLRPLPFAAPDRLVTLWDTNAEKGLAHDPISPVNFMDYRALPVFSDAAAWWRAGRQFDRSRIGSGARQHHRGRRQPVRRPGRRPQVGVGFLVNGPMFVQNELMVVISDRLWRTRYSADPSIIGKQLSLNDTPYTVVGVMPAKFHYPGDIDVWQRLRWDLTRHSRSAHFMEAVGRLKDGTTFDVEAQRRCHARPAAADGLSQHEQGMVVAAGAASTNNSLPPACAHRDVRRGGSAARHRTRHRHRCC